MTPVKSSVSVKSVHEGHATPVKSLVGVHATPVKSSMGVKLAHAEHVTPVKSSVGVHATPVKSSVGMKLVYAEYATPVKSSVGVQLVHTGHGGCRACDPCSIISECKIGACRT